MNSCSFFTKENNECESVEDLEGDDAETLVCFDDSTCISHCRETIYCEHFEYVKPSKHLKDKNSDHLIFAQTLGLEVPFFTNSSFLPLFSLSFLYI